MSKRGNSRDLSKNACTRACTHSRPPGLRQTVGGEAVSPALAPAAVGLPLLPAADNAGRTQALSSELVASQGLPRTLAAARAPSLGSADSGSPQWGLSRRKFNTDTRQLGGSHGWHHTPHPLVCGHSSAQRGSEACPGSHGSRQTG